jgi:tetratricopeptide (TPR) repeat protein
MESFAQFLAGLDKMERWLQHNKAEAERWLPRVLALSGPDLSLELARHPELQPGISRLLLEVVDDTVSRDPARAHELTTVVIEYAGTNMSRPSHRMEPFLRANAWTAHAVALRGLDRHLEALAAIAAALDACRERYVGARAWSTALAEVVEAQIFHDMGQSAEALRLIRGAAEVILLHGDVKRYVQVRMYEALILWETGERTGAAEVWRTMAREAALRGDALFMAVLESAIAVFQLRHGGAEAAARLFEIAHGVFDTEGLTREAIGARRGMAAAAAARGRHHDAISEYYKVQALALAAGSLREAALASAEIVELLLLAGREREVLPLANSMVSVFTDAGQQNAVNSWLLLRDFALMQQLTRDRVDVLRTFFRDFVMQPDARL